MQKEGEGSKPRSILVKGLTGLAKSETLLGRGGVAWAEARRSFVRRAKAVERGS